VSTGVAHAARLSSLSTTRPLLLSTARTPKQRGTPKAASGVSKTASASGAGLSGVKGTRPAASAGSS